MACLENNPPTRPAWELPMEDPCVKRNLMEEEPIRQEARDVEGDALYALLHQVLRDAEWQAREGKGKERHAGEDEPFEKQIICEVAKPGRAGIGYVVGQAVKKAYEARRMVQRAAEAAREGNAEHAGDLVDAARRELLGGINYLAAAWIVASEYVPFVVDPDGGGR